MTATTLQTNALPLAHWVPSDTLVLGAVFLLAIVLIAGIRRGGIRGVFRRRSASMRVEIDPEPSEIHKKSAKGKKRGAKKTGKRKDARKRRQPVAHRVRPAPGAGSRAQPPT